MNDSGNAPLRIAPSILAADFLRLGDEVTRAEEAGADWLHVDVMDGHFVPNLSIGLPIVEALRSHTQTLLDVHIMISNPDRWAAEYVRAGADIVSFHVEATHHPDRVVESIIEAGGKASVAVNPDTSLHRVLPLLDQLSMVLVMSVYPGFGGQSFLPHVLDKVRELRAAGFEGDIEMDGGIGPDTIGQAAAAGVNVFVAGTALYKADDMRERLAMLRERAASSMALAAGEG